MASGRMFSIEFVDSDLFAFLSLEGQCLYFHFAMSADDEGYVSSTKRIIKNLNLNEEVLSELKAGGLVYEFPSGVCLIRHWHKNNQISPTKRKPTTFVNEKAYVILGADKVYYINKNPSVSSLSAQNRIGEVKVDEVSSAEASAGELSDTSHSLIRYGVCENVILTTEQYHKLAERYPEDYLQKIDRLSTYMASHNREFKDHFATIVKWAREDECAYNKEPQNGACRSNNVFKHLLENGEVSND